MNSQDLNCQNWDLLQAHLGFDFMIKKKKLQVYLQWQDNVKTQAPPEVKN